VATLRAVLSALSGDHTGSVVKELFQDAPTHKTLDCELQVCKDEERGTTANGFLLPFLEVLRLLHWSAIILFVRCVVSKGHSGKGYAMGDPLQVVGCLPQGQLQNSPAWRQHWSPARVCTSWLCNLMAMRP